MCGEWLGRYVPTVYFVGIITAFPSLCMKLDIPNIYNYPIKLDYMAHVSICESSSSLHHCSWLLYTLFIVIKNNNHIMSNYLYFYLVTTLDQLIDWDNVPQILAFSARQTGTMQITDLAVATMSSTVPRGHIFLCARAYILAWDGIKCTLIFVSQFVSRGTYHLSPFLYSPFHNTVWDRNHNVTIL